MIKFSLGKNGPQATALPIHGMTLNIALVYIRDLPAVCSALKRTKGYSTLEEVRPTLRNKPSGLKPDWHRTVSGPSGSRQRPASAVIPQSSSSSLASMSPGVHYSPPPEFDHTSSLLAMSPPVFSRGSLPPLHGNFTPPVNEPMEYPEHARSFTVCISSPLPTLLKPHSSSPSLYPALTRMTKVKSNSQD